MTTSQDSTPPGGWPQPQSAYIHVPFCRHRCGYCNFSVVAGRDELVDRFLNAMDRELTVLDKPSIKTLFVGGGTPTHLTIDRLERFLALLTDRLVLASDAEWSVEANPEDVTPEKLHLLKSFGVNRISLGVQSFDAEKLSVLERSHSGQVAADVVRAVADQIPNVSVDLIFAAPGEKLATWKHDLTTAYSLPITHLSTYALTFEKGTPYWMRQKRGELSAVPEQLEVEMYDAARNAAERANWDHYEVSSFARAGWQCQHNLAYWQGRGWFAAGPGAASFLDGKRSVNHRSTTTYLRRIENGENPVAESEAISLEQYARERMAFGIRMLGGIDISEVSNETGVDLAKMHASAIKKLSSEGLVSESAGWLRLTSHGVMFADTVASVFL